MKKRQSTLPVRVFTYGAVVSPTTAKQIDDQLRLARSYYNRRIEIEIARREAYRAVLRTSSNVAELENEIKDVSELIESMRTHVNKQRTAARRRVTQPLASNEIRQLRERRKELVKQLRNAKLVLRTDPHVALEAVRINEQAKQQIKDARKNSGCYWGTYLLVESSVEQAFRHKTDPRFRRWNGSGRVGVQLQHGLPVAKLADGGDTRFQVENLPAETWQTRSGRRHAYAKTKLRIGSTPQKRPVFAEFSVLMHRPLPADGRITNVALKRVPIARKYEYQLLVTVEAESLARVTMPHAAPVAAVNFGWRVTDEGLRVATLVDEFGHVQRLVLPHRILTKLDKARSLQSIRSTNLDAWRPEFIERLRALPTKPDWLVDDMKTIEHWRSMDRFSRLVLRMLNAPRSDAFPRELLVFADEWRRQDLHLLQWEAYSTQNALLGRREQYRLFAAELAAKYSKVVVDDFDLRRVSQQPRPEDDDDVAVQAVRRNRVRAAISTLRSCLEHKLPVEKLPAAPRTLVCSHCRQQQSFDVALHVEHTCVDCGAKWDQDVNHARNLLRDYALKQFTEIDTCVVSRPQE